MIKINVILLITAMMAIFSNFAIDFFVPSLPSITSSFNSPYIQLAVSVYLVAAGLGQLGYGPLSDYYGRKKIILVGVTISIVGGFLCGVTQSITLFLLGRFIQGLGLASCLAMVRSILRDCYDKNIISKMYSYITICMEGTTLAAPIIGSYIQFLYGWRMNFHFFTGFSLLLLTSIFIFLPETNKNKIKINAMTFILECRCILKDKYFLMYSLCSTFAASGVYIYLSISPYLFEKILGLSAIQYSYTACLASTALVIGAIINSRLVNRMNINTLILIGGGLILLSGVLIAIPLFFGIVNLFFILIPALLFMFGAALIFPNALAGALNHYSKIAGTSASLYGTCQFVGAFLFTFLVSLSKINSPLLLALTYMILGVAVVTIQFSFLL